MLRRGLIILLIGGLAACGTSGSINGDLRWGSPPPVQKEA